MAIMFLLFIMNLIPIVNSYFTGQDVEFWRLILLGFIVFLILISIIIANKEAKKDQMFTPTDEKVWQTSLLEKSKAKVKKLTLGTNLQYYYQRYYPKWRHYFVNELNYMHSKHVYLKFWNEEKTIEWIEQKEYRTNYKKWEVVVNGDLVTVAEFIPKLEELKRPEQKLEFYLDGNLYTILDENWNSTEIRILKNKMVIGSSNFCDKKIHFTVKDENEQLIATAIVAFHYVYDGKNVMYIKDKSNETSKNKSEAL